MAGIGGSATACTRLRLACASLHWTASCAVQGTAGKGVQSREAVALLAFGFACTGDMRRLFQLSSATNFQCRWVQGTIASGTL